MSCVGSFGKLKDILGVPFVPLMAVYDFFIKRALDQLFYNLYWKSNFILVGTPSGVTLAPEGAQHGWKSDFQIPNQITWEPFYCIEMDWIFAESMKRHMLDDNDGRNGVIIRGVTKGIEQKDLIKHLRTQARFKTDLNNLLHHKEYLLEGATNEAEAVPMSDEEILATMKNEVLAGAYYLKDFRGYKGYEPGDNVVNIFAMGSLGLEAAKASEELLAQGVYANVIIVTCTDLLVGNLGQETGYSHLKQNLDIDSNFHVSTQIQTQGEFFALAGRRIPIVSVHDGEPGLLDNIGSIIGTKQEALAVRKHSRCGRPTEVYKYQNIDSDAIVAATTKVLEDTAIEDVRISSTVIESLKRQ